MLVIGQASCLHELSSFASSASANPDTEMLLQDAASLLCTPMGISNEPKSKQRMQACYNAFWRMLVVCLLVQLQGHTLLVLCTILPLDHGHAVVHCTPLFMSCTMLRITALQLLLLTQQHFAATGQWRLCSKAAQVLADASALLANLVCSPALQNNSTV